MQDDGLTGGIWQVPDVEAEPEIVLIRWQIRRVIKSSYADTIGDHLVGYNTVNHEGRVSTTIEQFNPRTGVAVTTSGRTYQLRGPAGYDRDGAYVWHVWCRGAAVTEEIDVTAEYVENLKQGGGAVG